MATGREVAETIARALAGEVRELPTEGESARLVVMPGGRAPVLVRDFPRAVGACVPRGIGIIERTLDAANVAAVVASARDWLAKGDPDVVSMYGLALAMLALLQTELGERWFARMLGIPDPADLWLSGPSDGSVGVFPTQIIVWVGMTARTFPMSTLAELASMRTELLAAVTAQRASYQRHVETSAQIRDAAEPLAKRLTKQLGLAAKVRIAGVITHNGGEEATIEIGNRKVTIKLEDDVVRIHGGGSGRDGFDGTLDELDAQFDDLVAAVMRAHKQLTLADLEPGARYRVLKAIGQLTAGTVVTFVAYHDIDNHYGEYVFSQGDQELVVGGDYSSDRTELGQTHRYLAPAPAPTPA